MELVASLFYKRNTDVQRGIYGEDQNNLKFPIIERISSPPDQILLMETINHHNVGDHEELNPLLISPVVGNDSKFNHNKTDCKAVDGWTAKGLPLGHGSVIGEPVGRGHWDSGLCACFGRNDEFCSSDLEVCLLGSLAPCVLHGSNVERLGSVPGTFANHCLPYTGLYLIGNSLFGWNCLAPFFSYTTRTVIRRKFNIEGSCEALNRSCGCCGSCLEDEFQRELSETVCDLTIHACCHPCALCQEGREIRRRLVHPGFNTQPVLVMTPPVDQTMGRGA